MREDMIEAGGLSTAFGNQTDFLRASADYALMSEAFGYQNAALNAAMRYDLSISEMKSFHGLGKVEMHGSWTQAWIVEAEFRSVL